ncbi:hypothetical protein QA597_08085 [Marinilabiliaceae bacterium ANBcel2]|nr:hypothetical protein [Marinilabiliaceae bacterium ANBcel2]
MIKHLLPTQIKSFIKSNIFEFYKNKSYGYYDSTSFSIISTPPRLNITIDIVGPSGIGKSYFINKLIENKIITPAKIPFRISDQEITIDEHNDYCHFKLLQNRVNADGDKTSLYSEPNLKKIRYKLEWLIRDIYLRKLNKPFIIDEGITHHFTGAIIQLNESNPLVIKEILKNKAIINLTSNPKTINKRIRKRIQERGKIQWRHKNLNEQELIDLNLRVMNSKKKLCSIASQHNCPNININLDDDIQQNLDLVKSFINNLQPQLLAPNK